MGGVNGGVALTTGRAKSMGMGVSVGMGVGMVHVEGEAPAGPSVTSIGLLGILPALSGGMGVGAGVI
jgi:hypothetical protein